MQEAMPGPLRKAHDPDGADPSALAPAVPPLPASQARVPHPAAGGLAAAAASARAVVEDVIRAWRVPVDADVAVLLTSELVTNAVTHGTQEHGNVRASSPSPATRPCCGWMSMTGRATSRCSTSAPAEAETGRGLLLVTSLSAEWGFYRTAAGKAVYFTLDLRAMASEPQPD